MLNRAACACVSGMKIFLYGLHPMLFVQTAVRKVLHYVELTTFCVRAHHCAPRCASWAGNTQDKLSGRRSALRVAAEQG